MAHESPYALLAAALRDRKATARIAIEDTVPFVFADGLGQALPAARLVSGTPVTAGCRMVKDVHEVALMRRACEITVRVHRAVFASLREGMTQAEASALSREAHKRLGATGGSLVLFGPDAAFPHGTSKPRSLRGGDVVLIDGGGSPTATRATSRGRWSSAQSPRIGILTWSAATRLRCGPA